MAYRGPESKQMLTPLSPAWQKQQCKGKQKLSLRSPIALWTITLQFITFLAFGAKII